MKVVMTAAVMDLCHKGHLNLLREMRKEAGEQGAVIVIIHDDKSIYETKGKIPIQNLEQRVKNIEITGLADMVLTCSDYESLKKKIFFLHNLINGYAYGTEPLWMRGNDWDRFPCIEVLEELRIPIKMIQYTDGVSSTFIRETLEDQHGKN